MPTPRLSSGAGSSYPGASAQDVEEGICQRIEDALDGVRFVKEVRSEAREGIGVVTAEIESLCVECFALRNDL